MIAQSQIPSFLCERWSQMLALGHLKLHAYHHIELYISLPMCPKLKMAVFLENAKRKEGSVGK